MKQTEQQFIKKAIKYLGCNTARISKPCGTFFLIIGYNRNTKDGDGYWTKNGERYDFDYVEEKVVASGDDFEKLWKSVKQYKKVLRIGWRAVLPKRVCDNLGIK